METWKVLRVEEVHKQKHRLYLNYENIPLTIYKDLKRFETVFFDTIEKFESNLKIGDRYEKKRIIGWLVVVLNHILNLYIANVLLKWSVDPQIKKDITLLNKMISLVIFTVVEMNTELSKKFNLELKLPEEPNKITMGQLHSPIISSVLRNSFLLTPNKLKDMVNEYRKHDLGFEIIPLIEVVWKISYPLFKQTDIHYEQLNKIFRFPDHNDQIAQDFVSLMYVGSSKDHLETINEINKSRPTYSKIDALFKINFKTEEERKGLNDFCIKILEERSNKDEKKV